MTTAEKLTLIAENQQKVYDAGFAAGKAQGGDGSGNSYDDGYTAGQQAEYDRFWDAYQDNGNRTNYERAFAGIGWDDELFNPKYKVTVVGSAYMTFAQTNITEITPEKVDFSGATSYNYTFYYNNSLKKVEIDCSSAKTLNDSFYGGTLTDIILLNVPETCSIASFRKAAAHLKSITNFAITGVIGNTTEMSGLTNISKDNYYGIINCLSDSTSGLGISLSLSGVNTTFETAEGLADGSTSEEWLTLVETKPNWTISLA